MKSLKVDFNGKNILILYNNNDIWFRYKNISNFIKLQDEYISNENIKRVKYNSRFIHENGIIELIENLSDKDILTNLIEFVKNEILLDKELNIFDFIKSKDYQLNLGNWFEDIWIPLFNKKDIIITNNILNFLYNDSYSQGGKSFHPCKDDQKKIDLQGGKSFHPYKDDILYQKKRDLQVGKDFPTCKDDVLCQKKRDYIKFLKKNKIDHEMIRYNENIINEYSFLENDIKNLKPHSLVQKTWIQMNIDDFKESVMLLNTSNAKEVKRYYIFIEKVLFDYANYINNVKEKETQRLLNIQNDKIKEQNNTIQSLELFKENTEHFLINTKAKSEDGYIYIFTTKQYAAHNRFKIGRTNNLENRKANYNSSHVSTDLFYPCYAKKTFDVIRVEKMILDILEDFRDSKHKEFINMHYTYLVEIIDMIIKNMREPYEYINDLIKNKLVKMYELRPIIPKEVEINEEKILLEELKEKIYKFLDDEILKGNLKFTRQELIYKLNLTGNKIIIWDKFKQILKWVDSNTAIKYKDKKIYIKYK